MTMHLDNRFSMINTKKYKAKITKGKLKELELRWRQHNKSMKQKHMHHLRYEKFEDYVMGEEDGIAKTPEWAEKITDVPARTISTLAREYATLKPGCLRPGLGPQRTYTGEQFARAASVLAIMTGNVGIHGGNPAGASFGPGPGPGIFPPCPENKVKIVVPIFLWPDLLLRGKSGGYATDKTTSSRWWRGFSNDLLNIHSLVFLYFVIIKS